MRENERRLAINAAIAISRGADSAAALLARIGEIARKDAAMTDAFETSIRPTPKSGLYAEHEHQIKELQARRR